MLGIYVRRHDSRMYCVTKGVIERRQSVGNKGFFFFFKETVPAITVAAVTIVLLALDSSKGKLK